MAGETGGVALNAEFFEEALESAVETGGKGYEEVSSEIRATIASLDDKDFELIRDGLRRRAEQVSDGEGHWSDLDLIVSRIEQDKQH